MSISPFRRWLEERSVRKNESARLTEELIAYLEAKKGSNGGVEDDYCVYPRQLSERDIRRAERQTENIDYDRLQKEIDDYHARRDAWVQAGRIGESPKFELGLLDKWREAWQRRRTRSG